MPGKDIVVIGAIQTIVAGLPGDFPGSIFVVGAPGS